MKNRIKIWVIKDAPSDIKEFSFSKLFIIAVGVLGISMALKTNNFLFMIISIVAGSIIGVNYTETMN